MGDAGRMRRVAAHRAKQGAGPRQVHPSYVRLASSRGRSAFRAGLDVPRYLEAVPYHNVVCRQLSSALRRGLCRGALPPSTLGRGPGIFLGAGSNEHRLRFQEESAPGGENLRISSARLPYSLRGWPASIWVRCAAYRSWSHRPNRGKLFALLRRDWTFAGHSARFPWSVECCDLRCPYILE